MAPPSERLAELRAALLELEACVAQRCAKEQPARLSTSLGGAFAGDAAAAVAAARRAIARRVLRPPIRALATWWQRRSRTKNVLPAIDDPTD
jgi:hypothetical protein